MISNIYNAGPWITVTNATPPYVNPNNPSSGMLRYHNNQLQVYDGSSWLGLSNSVSVGVTGEANDILEWGRRKMAEERQARALAEQHPAVADALDAVREAEQQLKTIVALCQV